MRSSYEDIYRYSADNYWRRVEEKKDKANIVDAVEWRVIRSSERPTICNLRLEKPTVFKRRQ